MTESSHGSVPARRTVPAWRSVPSRRILFALIAASLLVVACARNPVTGRRELTLVSEQQEIALGQQADSQTVATYGIYDDPKLAAYVDRIGQGLARRSDRPNLKYTFRVLDSPVVNAFALPGGFVYITRGILAYMNDEAELAMVMGHEIGHVAARHSVQQMTRSQLAGLGIGIGSILVPGAEKYGQLAQGAVGLLFLKYSRDDERQADHLGVQYSLRAGYDAEEGTKFFTVLDRITQASGQSLPDWLSTHPDPGQRVTTTADLARKLHPEFPNADIVDEATHKDEIEGIVFGENPRSGFVRDGAFLHPDLRFRFDLPQGWQVQNTPQVVVAADPRGQAALQLTIAAAQGLDPRAYGLRVVQGAGAQVVDSETETIGDADAFVAVIAVPVQDGTVPVLAAFLQRARQGPIYQFIGQAAEFSAMRPVLLGSIRSFAPLTDPAVLALQPDRVELKRLAGPGTLTAAIGNEPALPVGLQTLAIMNNVDPAENLPPGTLLKVVRGTFRLTEP